MAWTLVQTQTGSTPPIGVAGSPSGTVTYTLGFSSPVTASNVVFIILGLSGGPFIPMFSDTFPSDSLGTIYRRYWQSGSGGYPDAQVYAGQVTSSGTCNITFTFDWVATALGIYPPWAGEIILLEYSGAVMDSSFVSDTAIIDLGRGGFNSLNTGNTFGYSHDGYTPIGDVIVLSYAVNSYTGQLVVNSTTAPGFGIYSHTFPPGSVGSGGSGGPAPLPYYADIMVFGILSEGTGGGGPGVGAGLNQMFLRI